MRIVDNVTEPLLADRPDVAVDLERRIANITTGCLQLYIKTHTHLTMSSQLTNRIKLILPT